MTHEGSSHQILINQHLLFGVFKNGCHSSDRPPFALLSTRDRPAGLPSMCTEQGRLQQVSRVRAALPESQRSWTGMTGFEMTAIQVHPALPGYKRALKRQ